MFLACMVLGSQQAHAQLFDYKDYYSQPTYSVNKTEDLVYGIGATNYYLFNGTGDQNKRSDYNLVTQQTLTFDLYQPQMAEPLGKRAVLILVPGSGRNGCFTKGVCNQDTLRHNNLSTSTAQYIIQEGNNYNELDDRSNRARNFARRGVVVVSPVTRYQYQNRQIDNASAYRWTDDKGASLFNGVSTHLEPLVVDLKRLIRWLSKSENVSKYNIDPENIFILGASGASKMAALTTISATNKLLADDPAQLNAGHSDYPFEVTNNNILIPQLPVRGAIMFAGDTNGTRNLRMMNSHTGDFMFWHGTTDRAILHGMAETIEEKCENVGCATQFYSLPGVEHKRTGQGKAVHTNTDEEVGFTAHVHDFVVNHLKKGGVDSRPIIRINHHTTQFNEKGGKARVEVVLDKPAKNDIKFTMSADQMREVTRENGLQGRYDLVEAFVANDSSSTGPIMYDQSTGVVYELESNLPASYRNLDNHTRGPGQGNPVLIPPSSDYLYGDFFGKKQRMTIPKGETKAVFSVNLVNDTLFEQNECFKVRLLNAQGDVRMENTVETIVIKDDDNPNASTSPVCANVSPLQNPEVSVRSTSVNEQAAQVDVEFVITGALEEEVVVNYRTRNSSANSLDYTGIEDSIVIARGSNRQVVTININDDSLVESDERFYVDIISVSGSAATIKDGTAAVTINDDDSPDPSSAQIAIKDSIFTSETSGVVYIRVSTDRVLTEDIVVSYRTMVGAARSRDGDYVYAEDKVTLKAGRDRVFIPITILDDSEAEDAEDFLVRLTGVDGDNATIVQNTARVRIVPSD